MSITAKSIVLDIANNWGNGFKMGVRAILFSLGGTQLTLIEGTHFTAYGSSAGATYLPKFSVNTDTSLIGPNGNNQWLGTSNTNQRISYVFNTPIEFDTIVIHNSHNSGATTDQGIKSTVLTASSDTIANSTYNGTITNPTVLFSGAIAVHVGSNVEDPQIIYESPIVYIPHRVSLYQPYELTPDLIRQGLVQIYSLTFLHRALLDAKYSLKLTAILTQYYGDVPRLRVALHQWYWDAVQNRVALVHEYGDSPRFRAELESNYHLFAEVVNDLIQKYTVTGTELQKDSIQQYGLALREPLSQELNQLYLILGGASASDMSMPEVYIDGGVVLMDSINYEGTLDSYCISATLGFKDYALYKKCKLGSTVKIVLGVDTANLFIESKQRSRQVLNPIQYYVNCTSLSTKLGSPYAEGIEGDLGPNWASDIANSVIADSGLTLVWDIVDQYYTSDTFFGNGDTPLDILRRLVNPTKGRIQTLLDGTVKVIPHYPDSPTTWGSVVPVAYLTDAQDFFNTGEQPAIRSGYNKFLISNTLTAEASDRLEEHIISDSKKYMEAYQVPWVEGTDIPFYTSGGSHVQITTNDVWLAGVTKEIPEQIEIVKGYGKVGFPLYGVVSFEYKSTHLGGLTVSEDGTIKTDIEEQSLLNITYTTKYRQWEVTDILVEDVQFILGEED